MERWMAKGGENTILEGINEMRKPREQQLGRKSARGGGVEERKRKNLPSSPNNHTTGGKKPHKGGKFFLHREKQELLSQERSRKFIFWKKYN
jgi:hypothetical protein